MELKILERVSVFDRGIFNIWKNFENLFDSLALLPVGGDATQTTTIDFTVFTSFVTRSYTSPKPINCLISSTGGCASNSSGIGILTSSIIIIPELKPGDGPMTFLIPTPLNLSSIYFCVI